MNVTTHRQEGGRFWSAAAAYAAFSRPQPALDRALRAEYASMELDKAPRPWLGAHLRYGDSCGARGKRTGRVCAAAEDYARVAADMILQYGYRSVVVATDTDAALDAFSEELKRLAPAVKVYARHDVRVDPKIYKKVKRMEKLFVTEDNGRAPPVVEPWAEYYGFAVDLLALADCDGFLGKFTSNLARAAYALMAHRRSCLLPYVSLDSPFCFGGRGFSRDSRKDRTHTVNGELMGDFNCGCADCLRGPLPRPHR